jgi:NAD(P)H-hydrate epimerase
MKVLSAKQIREADAYTIAHEPVKSIDLMERAATACVKWIEEEYVNLKKNFNEGVLHIFCGPGNNGGDGLAIARLLAGKRNNIHVYIIHAGGKYSEDFLINEERLKPVRGITIAGISRNTDLPVIDKKDTLIDALFGSGLSKVPEGIYSEVIHHINQSGAAVISIDIPSGLFCDQPSAGINKYIVEANYTLSFEFPKLAFLFPENGKYVGQWRVLPIGLGKKFIEDASTKNFFITHDDVAALYRPRDKFSHKGTYGQALLISGSYGKMGAALLGAKAGLRAGAGLLTVHVPKCGYNILQRTVPEAMAYVSEGENHISGRIKCEQYNAVAIGPGIGTAQDTASALKLLIQESPVAMILDADAINILSENKTWLSFIPKNSIFTPHPKEFERLIGKSTDNFERHKMQVDFAVKHGVYVVLKGSHTSIACPDGSTWFNSTGNPGMATAGSGDVLTGILLGLAAQGYTAHATCLLGIYLHGLAGDIAAKKMSEEAMMAGDIIENLGEAYGNFRKETGDVRF